MATTSCAGSRTVAATSSLIILLVMVCMAYGPARHHPTPIHRASIAVGRSITRGPGWKRAPSRTTEWLRDSDEGVWTVVGCGAGPRPRADAGAPTPRSTMRPGHCNSAREAFRRTPTRSGHMVHGSIGRWFADCCHRTTPLVRFRVAIRSMRENNSMAIRGRDVI